MILFPAFYILLLFPGLLLALLLGLHRQRGFAEVLGISFGLSLVLVSLFSAVVVSSIRGVPIVILVVSIFRVTAVLGVKPVPVTVRLEPAVPDDADRVMPAAATAGNIGASRNTSNRFEDVNRAIIDADTSFCLAFL